MPRAKKKNMDPFVECRVLGHAWDKFTPVYRSNFKELEHFRCVRCTSEKHEAINIYGDIIYRKYDYVEGYQYAKDERPTRAQMRLMMFDRKVRDG